MTPGPRPPQEKANQQLSRTQQLQMTWGMRTPKPSPSFPLCWSSSERHKSHVRLRYDSPCRRGKAAVTEPSPGPAWQHATYFSFSISMESLFMSVSLKSKDRLSLMRLKLGRSVGSAVVLEFMDCCGGRGQVNRLWPHVSAPIASVV